jgi:hypothetical protein
MVSPPVSVAYPKKTPRCSVVTRTARSFAGAKRFEPLRFGAADFLVAIG